MKKKNLFSDWEIQPVKFDPELHRENRLRLSESLKKEKFVGAYVLLQGGEAQERHETDHEELFRQESSFAWAFGVKEPGCFGAISVSTGKSLLFVPKYPPEYGIWMGPIRSLQSFIDEYKVDEAYYVDEITSVLKNLEYPKGPVLLTTSGLNTDSGRRVVEAFFSGIDSFRRYNGVAYDTICELRAVKTSRELCILRQVCELSSKAHCYVMQQAMVGMFEYQLESLFLHYAYYCGGCRHVSYTSICGCGPNSSTLHYGHAGAPNSKILNDGEICLCDMGAEGRFYGSDVTCSWPVNGTFTADQKIIYNAVYEAQLAVFHCLKPGICYVDMQTLSYKIILTKLRDEAKLLRGDIDAMMACNLGAIFMPHGLGHMLGIDTHDVAGKPEFSQELKRDDRAGYAKLRLLRPLREGNFITVEPGCYFIDYLLDQALADPVQSKFIIAERLKDFRGFGGVRLEDDVLITKTGMDNFTRCPRTIQDVESWMKGEIKDLNLLTCPFSPKYEHSIIE